MIEYADLECPYCAAAHLILKQLPIKRVFRHFPVVPSTHGRGCSPRPLTRRASRGSFWEMHDSLLEDQGHLDDPHLWARAERLGLDLDRFESDRRSDEAAERVERDFRGGIRAGVTTTPTQFVAGRAHPGVPGSGFLETVRGITPI